MKNFFQVCYNSSRFTSVAICLSGRREPAILLDQSQLESSRGSQEERRLHGQPHRLSGGRRQHHQQRHQEEVLQHQELVLHAQQGGEEGAEGGEDHQRLTFATIVTTCQAVYLVRFVNP